MRARLNSERFVDRAPPTVYAILLDEGAYLCSVSTMYRILRAAGEVRERRRQAVHPAHVKPELLAERLLADGIRNEGVDHAQLTIHSDHGSSMTSKPVALLPADLGVTKSHSRPHCSNDNPYSEAQFKTLKYRPGFPDRFGSREDGRSLCRRFFSWYCYHHRHSGIGYHTPADLHRGRAQLVRAGRAKVLAAYGQHPERFVRRPPEPPALPTAAWINRPLPEEVSA